MNMRAVPFYCPYCAEQSIEPVGEGRSYICSSCDRRFEVLFHGLGEADSTEGPGGERTSE